MKRTLLGLVMLSSLALMAAPRANAANLTECGKSYAFQVHGTEPELTNDQALHYIVGIGQISFNAAGTSGPTGCTVSHLELEYNDNAVLTLNGGPATCDSGSSLLGTGIPCFDGADHQNTVGTLTPSPFGNGGQRLTIDPSFSYVNTGPGSTHLPMAFTLQANTGAAVVLGAIVPDNGPNPTSPPPGSPVLVITMQKQSSTVTLPVVGPLGGSNGYGVAPYVGLSESLFEGYGAPAADPFGLPGITGSFGSTISALQIFTNGQAGGSTSFSSNDNVGNTTGVTENDCDTQLTQESNFGDGTSNNKAQIVHPSLTCGDAAGGAAFTIDTVQFGATDTSDYAIVSGLAATQTGGLLVPSGDIATALGLASVPAGKLTDLVVGTTITAVNKTATGTVKFTNTSPAGCDTTITMPSNSATNGPNTCSVSLSPASPAAYIAEGDTPSTLAATINCTCNGTTPAVSTTTTLKLNSSDCPETSFTPAGVNTTGVTITCKN